MLVVDLMSLHVNCQSGWRFVSLHVCTQLLFLAVFTLFIVEDDTKKKRGGDDKEANKITRNAYIQNSIKNEKPSVG